MWDNPRILNMAAGALVGIAALALTIAAGWMLLRSELFPVRELRIATSLEKTTRKDIEAAARDSIAGNFFAVSPLQVRLALEALPWVRRASVRRVWPGQLEVMIEEHVALARWGDEALVNSFGEKFTGRTDQALPLFVAPAGSEAEVARRYAGFSALVAPLGARVERVVLTPRFAWQLRLAGGLEIMLGRDAEAAEARLRRFVAVYDATLSRVQQRHEYVDLRYPTGFALRIPALERTGS